MSQLVSCVLLLGLCHGAMAADIAGTELEFGDGNVPVVLTPTRLRQSLQDVPASVTYLSRQMLQDFGVSNIPDALRLVPGMEVTQASGSWYQINYHGTASGNPRRMNVLIDGVSVYHPGLAEINWSELPIAMEDVDHIEVTRGPDSAAYGPNSMMAVINIITVHPDDTRAAEATAGGGTQRAHHVHVAVRKTFGSTTARLSASSDGNAGYSWLNAHDDGHNSTSSSRLTFHTTTELAGADTLQFEGAYVKGLNQSPFASQYEGYPDARINDIYLSATYLKSLSQNNDLKVQLSRSSNLVRQRWSSCFPTVTFLPQMFNLYKVDPTYPEDVYLGVLPVGANPSETYTIQQAALALQALGSGALTPLCGNVNADINQSRSDIELQDTAVLSDRLRMVAGVGARDQRATSQTYLGGSASQQTFRVFGNVEYTLIPSVELNVGAYAEHERLSGTTISPRVALSGHLDEHQTIRLTYSKGTRTPDIVEQQGNITYTLDGSAPGPGGATPVRFYQNALGNPNLRPEQLASVEVGYLWSYPRYGVLFDAKIFDDRLTDLVSQTVDVTAFPPTNANSVRLTGAEIQGNLSATKSWQGFFTYAFLLSHDATTILEQAQYSKHSGSVGATHVFTNDYRGSLAFYGSSGNPLGNSRYGRFDLSLSTRLPLLGPSGSLALRVSRLTNTQTTYQRPTALGISQFNSPYQAYVQISAAI